MFCKNCLSPPCPWQRPAVDEVLREGHISLSGLQLRAHAMFSAEGLPLGSDTLEYAWLIDVQAGSLTAKVTAPQVPSRNQSEVLKYCPSSFWNRHGVDFWKARDLCLTL